MKPSWNYFLANLHIFLSLIGHTLSYFVWLLGSYYCLFLPSCHPLYLWPLGSPLPNSSWPAPLLSLFPASKSPHAQGLCPWTCRLSTSTARVTSFLSVTFYSLLIPGFELWSPVWETEASFVSILTFNINRIVYLTSDSLFCGVWCFSEALLLRWTPRVRILHHPREPTVPCWSTAPQNSKAAGGSRRGTSPHLVIRCLRLIPRAYILHAFLITIKWHLW